MRAAPFDTADPASPLSSLVSNLGGMLYRCRIHGDWEMEFVSEGSLDLTGCRPQDPVLRNRLAYEQIVHPQDRARARQAIEHALANRRRYDIEYRMLRADGQIRWVREQGLAVTAPDGRPMALDGFVQDITERKRFEHELRETADHFRSFFENASEGMYRSTPAGFLTVNPAMARICGYDSPEQMIEQLRDIDRQLYFDPLRRNDFIREIETHGEVVDFESQICRRDGSPAWICENAHAMRDENGTLLYYEGTASLITRRKLHEAEIEYQATHDPLTGLPNRILLAETLRQVMAEAKLTHTQVAVMFIDIDQFKFINDSLGHAAGDELLSTLAQRLQSCIRGEDVVARHGGDEFVVVVKSFNNIDEVRRVAERIVGAVARPCVVAGCDLSASCSVGISLCPLDAQDIDTLLRNADAAMYRAKELGRNNFQFFAADMNAHFADRMELVARLHRALERSEFRLHYEPKFDLGTRRIVGAEVLIRWQTPDGIVSPADFIPVAEETGLIVPIGDWVLRTACAQARTWLSAGVPMVPMSVNLSRRQLVSGDIAAQVAEALVAAKLPAKYLELEVTESAVMRDTETAVEMLRRLRELGVKIAMDDFGTGYSSLYYLKQLPLDRLKIDQSFVRDVTTNPDDSAIIKAIISLGHILELRVLAEGVETAEQLDFLRDNHCDEMQGYHLARPMPASEFAALLRAQAVA
jgi:diguanylate cyclase (GGDEF)-like protein/PAS domain S-box-containing protein